MTLTHEKLVYARFDAIEAQFRTEVAYDDVRTTGLVGAIGPLVGKKLLDLGCGKGRFSRHFRGMGADVVGLDPSLGMLSRASTLPRVQGSATRLPFADHTFEIIVAVEVFEHLSRGGLDLAIAEAFRVLKADGLLAIIDKNAFALNAQRPYLPSLLVKWIDQRRGRWMYPPGSPVRERWFGPNRLARRLEAAFSDVTIAHLLSPDEARHRVFRMMPRTRLMTLWTARKPGRASLV